MNTVPFDIASSSIPALSAKKIQSSIRELEWCVEELSKFDVFSVNDRDDPRLDALEAAIEDALLALFDKTSSEFQRFHCDSLVDNACFSLAYPTPIHEVRQGLQAGMGDQTGRLKEALSALYEGLSIFHPEEVSSPAQEAQETSRAASLARTMAEMVGIRPSSAAPDSDLTPGGGLDADRPAGLGSEARNIMVLNSGDTPFMSAVVDFISKIDMIPAPVRSNDREGGTLFQIEDMQDAEFAVIVVTPDDIRTVNDPHTSPDFQPCPAQEILFGLGYLIGVLGPSRVCVLVVDNVELGLDRFNLHVTAMDRSEGWKLDLAKMIKAAGVSIDLNQAI